MLESELKELTQRIAIEFYRAKSMMLGSVYQPPEPVALIGKLTTPVTTDITVTASSYTGQDRNAVHAFDDKIDTAWWSTEGSIVTPSNPQWLAVKFNTESKTVSKYTLTNYNGGNRHGFQTSPKTWELQGRNGTGSWTTIHSVTDDTRNVYGQVREFSGFGTHTYSEFRLFITSANFIGYGMVNIGGFQLYGH